jgi:phosphoribosylamine--glycine ligase
MISQAPVTPVSVLVIGAGGREHAIAWRLSTSESVSRVVVAPGNAGMDLSPMDCEFERWPLKDFETIAQRAHEEKIALVVIGPDNALAEGIVDTFEKYGLLCFGPTQSAARIESSKEFAKDIMKAAGIPTAKYFVARSFSEAQKILKSVPWPSVANAQSVATNAHAVATNAHAVATNAHAVANSQTTIRAKGWVVKADGLAFGKGVEVCRDFEIAEKAALRLITISGTLVIEELLQGEEVSWFAFCDGEESVLFEPARDYKRLKENNQGPNTGGMGAYSPLPEVPLEWTKRIYDEVFSPALREMKKRGTPFKGLLYAGLMCDFPQNRFWVIEFNARFGDPETQVLLPRMIDDFYEWCLATAQGKLRDQIQKLGREVSSPQVKFSPEAAVGVVAAARGYPEQPEKGKSLNGAGLKRTTDGVIDYFFAGVSRSEPSGGLETSGGRVYLSLGLGAGFEQARARAYDQINSLQFEGMQVRPDVAEGVKL